MDPSTVSLQDLQDLKKERHIGSPTSILFLTKDQHHLWKEKRVVLLADFSTGIEEFSSYKMILFKITRKNNPIEKSSSQAGPNRGGGDLYFPRGREQQRP